MNRPALVRRTAVLWISILALLVPAGAAFAAAPTDKLAVLSRWTQTSASSFTAWRGASTDREPWTPYGFDWSTDYCSSSPDNPLGFSFKQSCQRHDFGYRNYKAMSQFPANKDRIDNAFHADLKRKCATYASARRPACLSLAWTYYQAVHALGSLVAVSDADLRRAADIRDRSLAHAVR
jgi:hypothetical protein